MCIFIAAIQTNSAVEVDCEISVRVHWLVSEQKHTTVKLVFMKTDKFIVVLTNSTLEGNCEIRIRGAQV